MADACRALTTGLAVLTMTLVTSGRLAAQELPAHPRDIEFPALTFSPPEASDYRTELAGGVPMFLAPSHEFPLITVTFTFRGGVYLEPEGAAGVAEALGAQIRSGGTATVSAAELDERFGFLAAQVSTSVGPEQSRASINCLAENFDEAFALFMDMVRNPGFDTKRLRLHKDEVLEQMGQRNDSPMSVAIIHLGELVYGPGHFLGRQATRATVEAVTPETLRALHARIFHPGNLIVSATGDFDSVELATQLTAALADWSHGEPAGDPPAPNALIKPGLYHAEVAQTDLPQGTALLITRSIERDDPDAIPLHVMNHVLGGGGFTSRITNRVRSDEGLAYVAASFLQPQVHFSGVWAAYFQSKNETVAFATKIIFEEIDRIRAEPVSREELTIARNSYIERFPQRFSSKRALLGVLVNDELTGRPAGYWRTYRDKVRAVDAADVRRVALKHLNPGEMLLLVVGDWGAIYPGDDEGRATMSDFFEGDVEHLPTRDPLTLEPIGK